MLSIDYDNIIKLALFIIALFGAYQGVSISNQKRYDDLDRRKADKEQVDQQARGLNHRISEIREDTIRSNNELKSDFKDKFEDLKEYLSKKIEP